MRIYPTVAEVSDAPCIVLALTAPGDGPGPHRYVVEAGSAEVDGALAPGTERRVEVPLRRGVRQLRLRATGSAVLADGRRVALKITDHEIRPCSEASR